MDDYIVIGPGAAGCVLANRLTDGGQISVLLLEAGGSDDRQEIQIPAAHVKLHHFLEYRWFAFTERFVARLYRCGRAKPKSFRRTAVVGAPPMVI